MTSKYNLKIPFQYTPFLWDMTTGYDNSQCFTLSQILIVEVADWAQYHSSCILISAYSQPHNVLSQDISSIHSKHNYFYTDI